MILLHLNPPCLSLSSYLSPHLSQCLSLSPFHSFSPSLSTSLLFLPPSLPLISSVHPCMTSHSTLQPTLQNHHYKSNQPITSQCSAGPIALTDVSASSDDVNHRCPHLGCRCHCRSWAHARSVTWIQEWTNEDAAIHKAKVALKAARSQNHASPRDHISW